MSRLVPLFGLILTFLFSLFLIGLSNTSAPVNQPETASSSPALLPIVVISEETVSVSAPSASTSTVAQTQTPKKKSDSPAAAPNASPATVQTTPAPVAVVIPTVSGSAALDTAAQSIRSALVNILCYVPPGSGLHSISGSGIFIDSKGVILTNAHIAQYFLLSDRGVSCTVRSGSPAADAYKAALLYISPSWIKANAKVITEALPTGTGEYDFALLAVTRTANAGSLPAAFPFVPLAYNPPALGTPIVIASYGAQFLQASQIQSALYPTIVFGSVKDVFTFATSTIDVLALGGSAAAQEGSSGGGITDASGSLIGTITTSTVEGTTDTRSLSAITASYIRAEYDKETGVSIESLFTQPLASSIAEFSQEIPSLEAIITANLP